MKKIRIGNHTFSITLDQYFNPELSLLMDEKSRVISISMNYTLSIENLYLFVLETEKSEAIVRFLQTNNFLGDQFTKLPVEIKQGAFGSVIAYELQEPAKDLFRELRRIKMK